MGSLNTIVQQMTVNLQLYQSEKIKLIRDEEPLLETSNLIVSFRWCMSRTFAAF